ncbi:DUF4032 domain-containing protein [Actinomadura luteofluorescens]
MAAPARPHPRGWPRPTSPILMARTGPDAKEIQARRLLDDIAAYRCHLNAPASARPKDLTETGRPPDTAG